MIYITFYREILIHFIAYDSPPYSLLAATQEANVIDKNSLNQFFNYLSSRKQKVRAGLFLHCTKNETVDLVTFTEEILNGKVYFLCSLNFSKYTEN